MWNIENFNYAYFFTKEEEKNNWPDGIPRARFGLSREMLRNSYDTKFREKLGLSPSCTVAKKVSKIDRWHIMKYWFWDVPKLYIFPKRTGAVLFDMCVTHGVNTAITLAQKGFNQTIGCYGSKLRTDGEITYTVTTALENETNKLLLHILAQRLQMLHGILGDSPYYEIWHGRCLRLKQYIGVSNEKRRLQR